MRLSTIHRCAAVLAVIAAVGCGDGGQQAGDSAAPLSRADVQTIEGTLAQVRAAFAERDADAVCDRISRSGHVLLGAVAHQRPRTCERDVRRFFKWLGRRHDGAEASRAPVAEVQGAGDDAWARIHLPGGRVVSVPFVRIDGEWRVRSLLNASLSRLQAAVIGDAHIPGTAPPREPDAAGTTSGDTEVVAWRVANGRRSRCPLNGNVTSGDCQMIVRARVRVSMLSAFGEMTLETCTARFDLFVDGRGRTLSYGPKFTRGDLCADIEPCGQSGRPLLQEGTLVRDSGGVLRMRSADACFDTCVGKFRGPIDAPVVPGRRARKEKVAIGSSGLQFVGTWSADLGAMHLTRARPK